MKHVNIRSLLWVLLMILSLTGCEAMGAEGNVGIGIVITVVAVILLGWLSVKFLGGVFKIGIWGVVILVLLVIGFIAWIIIESLG